MQIADVFRTVAEVILTAEILVLDSGSGTKCGAREKGFDFCFRVMSLSKVFLTWH